MRAMPLALLALIVAACSDAADDRLPALEARLSALEAAVGAIERPVDPTGAIVTLAERVAALEVAVKAVVVPRVPHLIVRETGQDLGPFVAWDMAWSAEIGIYYPTNGFSPVFETDDCTGDAFALSAIDRHAVGTDGQIYLIEANGAPCVAASVLHGPGKCVQWTPPSSQPACYRLHDTGIAGIMADRGNLLVELR